VTTERPWAGYFVEGHLTNYGVPVFHDHGGTTWRNPDGLVDASWMKALAAHLGITEAEAWNRTDSGSELLDHFFRASCGIVLELRRAGTSYRSRSYTAMRLDLAERIGRPCRRCWPGGLPA
jgi:hypothetical protein